MRYWTLVIVGTLLAASACRDRGPSPEDIVGTYAAELPAEVEPMRTVTLHLAEGNAAELSVAGPDRTRRETGTWLLGSRGDVRVVLARDGFGPVSNDITFQWSDGTLTAIAFDTVQWGGRGFSLVRQ
jgi:hypothetical protein